MELVDAQVASSTRLPWADKLLMPVGDIQYDGPGGAADLKRLKRHLEWGMEHDAMFIGMGDFLDFLSPSNRDKLAQSGIYDTAKEVIDRAATRLEDELWEEVLAPTTGRWIGLLQGHHYYAHLDGTTTDTRFCERLGATFLGDCALIRLTFTDPIGGSANVKLWAHHGAGGAGLLPTTALNKLYHQKVRYPGVRLFMMGHVPQIGSVSTDGLDITSSGKPHLTREDTHYVTTGGFARGYQQGSTFAGRAQGGYAEKAMMPPAVLGGVVIKFSPERHESRGRKSRGVDIKVSV